MFKQEDGANPKILFSRISPPIFIDSRRSARGHQKQKILANSFCDAFEYNQLAKKFFKKDAKSKDRRENNTEEIDNSLKGLFAYLTAANIRHKIKHPLWMSMRFSHGMSIYLNVDDFDINDPKTTIRKFHDIVYESVEKKSTLLQVNKAKVVLLLNIASTKENVIHVKKICDIISPIESKYIQIMVEEDQIPEGFVRLEINEGVLEAYKELSQDMILATDKDKESYENLDDDDEEPPTNYGDQSYAQRTCIYILNREMLEREYNMTEMNFFNANFFNIKSGELDLNNKYTKKEMRKQLMGDLFEADVEEHKPVKKLKEDFDKYPISHMNQIEGTEDIPNRDAAFRFQGQVNPFVKQEHVENVDESPLGENNTTTVA